MLLIIGIIILSGVLNPWTGLFSGMYKNTQRETVKRIEPQHKSFRLTKGC